MNNLLVGLVSFFAAVCSISRCARAEFTHPGIAHDIESIEFVKSMVADQQQPWAGAWEKLKDSRYASLDWQPMPFQRVERGPYNNPNIGSSEFSNDGRAAYYHALCWVLSGNERHAQKSQEIIDAWSATLESIGNHDARLLIGMSGFHYCVAAELVRHTWGQWPEPNQVRFESMLRDVWYPVIMDFYPTANGNWDASMMQAMLAIGVFLDDEEIFNRAKDYYLSGEGNGAIGKYFLDSGECQESGRDQAHTQMGLEFLANTCETAWIQGIDLYGALDNRLLKGFEYTAKYNLGMEVPYVPYKSVEGRYFYKRISSDDRGRFRAMYERVYSHYQHRARIDAPYTKQAVDRCRDSRAERRGRRRTSYFVDTLMYAKESVESSAGESSVLNAGESTSDAGVSERPKVVCFGDSITKRGYSEILSRLARVDAINAGVGGNSTAKALKRMTKDVLSHEPEFVVILFGTNDLRADAQRVHVPLDQYKSNLVTMVTRCQQLGSEVILCSLPPIETEAFFTRHEREPFQALGGLQTMIESYRDAARQVALDQKSTFVDLNSLLSREPEWLSPDGVHPTEAGNAIIAKHVAKAVLSLKAK